MKKIRLAIAIISAGKYPDRRTRCRRLWTHELGLFPDVIWRFVIGSQVNITCNRDAEPDTLELQCKDDYPSLPQKTRASLRWFLENFDFDYLFKCDDDTYVRVERLLKYNPPAEYCGWGASLSFANAGRYASGGAGYFLSNRAAKIAADYLENHPTGAEDVLVGRGLAEAGILLQHDSKFGWNAHPNIIPSPKNTTITAHWVNTPEKEALVRSPWTTRKHVPSAETDLVLKIRSRVIRWVIGPSHDREFTANVLLRWAVPEAIRMSPETKADFTVGVYLASGIDIARVTDAPGMRFLLAGESETRYPRGKDCYQFVQQAQNEDDEWTRYCPTLGVWTPPKHQGKKLRPCSIFESKGRPERLKQYDDLRKFVKELDGYGATYGRPLGGYHCVGPDPQVFSKYEGLVAYGFSVAIERVDAEDYLTEKFADPILCEAVPLYQGCTNIDEFALPGSYHQLSQANQINWDDWQSEYAKRRPAVLRQKELIRSHFNILSYFIQLTGRLDLLDLNRPLTLSTIGSS